MSGEPADTVAAQEGSFPRLSHELRTRLTALHLFLSLVADGSAGPLNLEQLDYLEVAARNLSQLEGVTEEMLALISAGEKQA
jgi:signal transduction histidine kinase